jgi:GNAT superfamily N-acetyltransferase
MIRQGNPSDLSDVHNLLSENLIERNAQSAIETIKRIDFSQLYFYVYCEDSSVKGFITAIKRESGTNLDRYMYNGYSMCPVQKYVLLKRLYIQPDYRGQGIGTKLLNRVFTVASSEGFSEYYAEVWIQPERPDGQDLLQSIAPIERLRGGEQHYTSNIQEMSETELEKVCSGCKNKNRSCTCSGVVYYVNPDFR